MSGADGDPWQLVAEWFWLAHDEQSGKSLISSTQTGLGLAAGLLTELVVTDYVRLERDRVVVTTRRSPPDVLAHQVFAVIAGEPEPLGLPLWLAYLARSAREDVGTQLQRSGLVTGWRTRLRRQRRWVPVDVNASGWPAARLRATMAGRRGWTVTEVLLVGLSEATGLLDEILDAAEARQARADLPELVRRLSPTLSAVLDQTRVAVGAAVLSERS